jgi:hypothetical protein
VAEYLQNQKRSEISHLESEYDMSIHISGGSGLAWDECRIETQRREMSAAVETNGQAARAGRPPGEKDEPLPRPEPPDRGKPEPSHPAPEMLKEAAPEPAPSIPPAADVAAGAEAEAAGKEAPQTPAAPPAAETTSPAAGATSPRKRSHRRSRHRRKKPAESAVNGSPAPQVATPVPASDAKTPPEAAAQREPARIHPPQAGPEPPKPAPTADKATQQAQAPEDPLLRLRKVFETLTD